VTVQLIGGLRVARDGTALELPQSKKTLALLAYLVSNGRAHRRSHLANLLWCDVDDPRGGLRWSLSKVRGLLDDDTHARVRADREEISLDTTALGCDANAVRALARRAAEATPDELAAAMEQIADGELLEDIDLPDCPDFHAWCVATREEVRQAIGTVLAELVRRIADREPSRTVAYARRWILVDREDERSHVALVTALARAGRTREVDEHMRAHTTWLAERGRVPGAALRHAAYAAAGGTAVELPAPADAGARGVPPAQQIRFCTAPDGVRIAFATLGEGPPLVKTTNWMSHLEHEWRSPVWSHWLHELARGRTLIRYDQRGNGLSDRDVADISFEAFVRDLETVVDASGLERFPLIGISQGCAVAVAYAARHPERVTKLVLIAGFVRGWRVRNIPRMTAAMEAMMTLMRHGWGTAHPAFRQTFTTMFFPDADLATMHEFNELQRRTTSPDHAARLLSAFGDFEAMDQLARVRAPTLVAHSRHDGLIPLAWGREIAAGIPGARFVTLESRNHLLLENEPAWAQLVAELRAFLG
jgi:pimeloyl-ACP methyl ester carboxylesterase